MQLNSLKVGSIIHLNTLFHVNGANLIIQPAKVMNVHTYNYFYINIYGREKPLIFNTTGPQDAEERIAEANNISIIGIYMIVDELIKNKCNSEKLDREAIVKQIFDTIALVRKQYLPLIKN